jgi:hypothetical protein
VINQNIADINGDNQTTVAQAGTGNAATIDQTDGNTNIATVTQNGTNANTVVAQSGSYNTSTIDQGGTVLDTASANQTGNGNVATINQHITDTYVSIDNAIVVQNGYANTLSITQQ